MNPDAITPEAKLLNAGRDYLPDRMSQLDELDERRAMTLLLPEGKVLDQAMLDVVKNQANQWGPWNVLRQRLIEAGARNIGPGMILNPEQVEKLRERVRAERRPAPAARGGVA